jgi:hypothetical protein
MSVPMQLEVVPVSSCTWADDDEKSEIQGYLRRARKNEGREILLRVQVRQGHSHVDFSVPGGLQTRSARTFPLSTTFSDPGESH